MFTQKLSWMFKTTLFIIVKNWKHLSCPLVIERLNQLVHPHHGYYSARRSWYIQPGWIPRKLCWMKKPVSKDYTPYNFIYITALMWQNYGQGEQISPCQVSVRESSVLKKSFYILIAVVVTQIYISQNDKEISTHCTTVNFPVLFFLKLDFILLPRFCFYFLGIVNGLCW